MTRSKSLMRLLVCFVVLGIHVVDAFAPPSPHVLVSKSPSVGARTAFTTCIPPRQQATTTKLQAAPELHLITSSNTLAAATIDPTAVLGNALGSFLTSPAILAIPIVAALLVGGILAWLLVASAAPEVEDD